MGRVEFRRSELRHKGLQWATAFEAYLEALNSPKRRSASISDVFEPFTGLGHVEDACAAHADSSSPSRSFLD